MAVLELYGKCKELGYCDCGGFLGCVDPKPPAPKPVIENELRNALEAERQTSDYQNSNYRRELEEIEQSEGALVECEVCDRSHLSDHPHITNIEGDVPIDHEPQRQSEVQVFGALPPEDQLPEWLRDKPGTQAIRPSTGTADQVDPTKLCQVCGKPWAPKHVCNPTDATVTKKRVMPYHMRQYARCDVCGRKKQSNHKCKGKVLAVEAADGCEDCKRAGELCVRHGGLWSGYDTPKGEQVARQLPEPVPVTMPATVEESAAAVEPDRELAAIGTILEAVDGLGQNNLSGR
jgi:hypothetical protein